MDTLLLNADGNPLSMLPVSMVTWQTAIRLLVTEKVHVIKEHDWVVRSPSVSIPVPSIMMTHKYAKWPKTVTFSRFHLFLRDDFTCQLQITSRCARDHGKGHPQSDLTMDHVKPKSFGGGQCWDNIVTACGECNSHKGNATVKPKKIPRMPTYYELIEKRKSSPITIRDLAWLDYLDWDREMVIYHPHGGKRIKLVDIQGDLHDYGSNRNTN